MTPTGDGAARAGRLIVLGLTVCVLGGCASLPGGKTRKVLDAKWMTEDFSVEIQQALPCQPLGILVTTRGYLPGEPVTVTISEVDDTYLDVKLHGNVDPDGKARVLFRPDGCDEPAPDPVPSDLQAPQADAPPPPPNSPNENPRMRA